MFEYCDDPGKDTRGHACSDLASGLPEVGVSVSFEDINASEVMNAVADIAGYKLAEETNADGRLTILVQARDALTPR